MAMMHDSSEPEGIVDLNGKTTNDLLRAKQRKGIAAMELFLRVRSWDTVAEAVGYPSARAAKVAGERALEKEALESPRNKDLQRALVYKHYELLLRSTASKASDTNHPEHLAAVRMQKDILAVQSKLHGLDAPTQLSLVDPTAEQIEEFLEQHLGPRKIPENVDILELDEDDIVELEE